MAQTFADEYNTDDYDADDVSTFEQLHDHYVAMCNDMVDVWGANRPFGVYYLMNELKNRVWNIRRQRDWTIKNRLTPLKQRVERMVQQYQGSEVDDTAIQNATQGVLQITEELQFLKGLEISVAEVHDRAVDTFSGSPQRDDDPNRVFQFRYLDAPRDTGKATQIPASLIEAVNALNAVEMPEEPEVTETKEPSATEQLLNQLKASLK